MDTTDAGRRRTVAVIGGGIAGLTAAYRLVCANRKVDVIVLEGSEAVGGKLRLGEVAGHRVDLGAEAMLNRRPEAVALARAIGLSDSIVHPATTKAGIWTREAVRPLPPTLMGVPSDPAAVAAAGILSASEAELASREETLGQVDLSSDISVGRLVADRLGTAVRDRLVEPLLGGVYAGHADELSLYATVPQLVDGLRNHGGLLAAARASTEAPAAARPVFAGLVGGVGRLAEQLAAVIESKGASIRVATMVRQLRRTAGGWRLVVGPTPQPEVIDVSAVIIAVPAAPAARLLSHDVPGAAAELSRIEYASMALVTLAFEVPANGVVGLDGSGFLVPPVDGRLVKAATYSSQKWDWSGADETLIVRCSIGRHREESELQRDDADLAGSAMREVREATGLALPAIDAQVTRWGGALPQYAVGHLDRVRRVRAAVGAVPGIDVCGAAYDGVGIAAVVAGATAAATRVAAAIRSADTMGS